MIVKPGDLIMADIDGALVVPRHLIVDVLQRQDFLVRHGLYFPGDLEQFLVAEVEFEFPRAVLYDVLADQPMGDVERARNAKVVEVENLVAFDVAQKGAAGIIYTDIDRDGTGAGINVEATARIADAVTIPVYASGGVHSVDDVRRLREAGGRDIAGVIVGRALYDGDVELDELLAAAA